MKANDRLSYADNFVERVLFEPDEIRERVTSLGREISRDYAESGVQLIGVLKGSLWILADLVRAINVPVTVDFIAATSYGPSVPGSSAIRLIKDLDQPIDGQNVLVVEGIVDTGLSLHYVLRTLRARHPASLDVLTFLDKPVRRLIDFPLRYVGFTVPDHFVIGYGLDYRERFRNLPYIATLKPTMIGS